MKLLSPILILVFIVSCVAQETNLKAKPHSRLSFSWVNAEGSKNELWIWSFEKIWYDDSYSHKKIDAKLEHKYLFGGGINIEVKKSGVFVNGENQGILTGNYVFSERKLRSGFIRTFR
jgi:hypothetical protein